MDFTNLIEILNSKGFNAKAFDTKEEARDFVLSMIEEGSTAGMGGSESVNSLNLPQLLIDKGITFYSRRLTQGMTTEEIIKSANNADYFLCSTNAITLDGKLVNIDGLCNRISAMCYGPKNVVYIIGKNKVSENVETAIARIKAVACPKNAERLNLSTPCRYGKCNDCNSPDRMCRATLITERPPRQTKVHLLFVNEELGY